MRKSVELIFGFCIEALIQSTLSPCLVSTGSKHTTLTRSIPTWFNVAELVWTRVSIMFDLQSG